MRRWGSICWSWYLDMLPLTESLPGIRGCGEGLSLRPGPPGGRLPCSLCFGDCVRCGDLMVNKTEYCPLWNAWKYLQERRWYWLNYIVTSSCFVVIRAALWQLSCLCLSALRVTVSPSSRAKGRGGFMWLQNPTLWARLWGWRDFEKPGLCSTSAQLRTHLSLKGELT